MQASIQKKQNFLRTQVIQKGYQPDQFIDYLNSVNITADINALQYKELANIVHQFRIKKQKQDIQKIKSKIQGIRNNQKGISLQPLQIPLTQEEKIISKPKIINYEKYGFICQQQQFQRIFKCLKFNPRTDREPIPKIIVSDPKRQSSGGLFGLGTTSFLLFKIQTIQYGWQVRRRYSDFQWLRTTIQKFYPTYIVPPIPKKNAAKRTVRDLQKRMRILTFFLNDLSNIPEIFNNKYVEGFMSISSEQKFDELKKQANKKQYAGTISTLQTPTGQFKVKLTSQRKIYNDQIEKFINGAEVLYKQINRNSKKLQQNYIEETNTLYRMGNQFAQLHSLLKNFNNKVPNYPQKILNDTFITLNNMMIQWGNIIRNQHEFIEKHFNTFLRYTRNELYSIRQLQTKVFSMEAEYFKNKQFLQKKKDKIFSLGDINKWQVPSSDLANISGSTLKNKSEAIKIMLPRETLQLQKQKLKYAFYNSQFFDHSYKSMTNTTNKFSDNFKEFAVKIKIVGNQYTELWTDIATNFADPNKQLTVQPPIPKQEQIDDG